MIATVSDYLQLVTSQYQNSPKFLAWLSTPLEMWYGIQTFIESMSDDFDIDTAVGAQLDTVGVILGQTRTLPFQPTDGSSAFLDDATYRKVLKLKTMTNYWDGSLAGIYAAWNSVFPDVDLLITDNKDMTASVTITGSLTQIVIDMIHHDLIIPRPEGVEYWYGGTIGIIAIFSYDSDLLDPVYFLGYDEGYWDSTIS